MRPAPPPSPSLPRSGNGRSGTIGALLVGLALGLGPVPAMELAQKCRNDRPGSRGPCPETHEQRMQVHRLLADGALHAAARAVVPRRPASNRAAQESAVLAATLQKVRTTLARRGGASLIFLRRYAIKLAAGAAAAAAGGEARALSYGAAEQPLDR